MSVRCPSRRAWSTIRPGGIFNSRWVAMKRFSATTGMLLLVGLLVLGGGFARTEDPQKSADADAKTKADASPRAPAKDDFANKTVKFEMRDKPWNQVLELLADWTGI